MGDENPIRTLGDYSKPSHEGYMNTIEIPVGNNVVTLRSDTIQLVQNGCSFHELRSEDLNQHLKDFFKLVDSLDLDGENRERTRLRLFQFSLRDQARNWLERLLAGSITTWEDLTTRFLAQFFPPGRTAKLRNDILMFQQHHGESLSKAWTRFKDLLQKIDRAAGSKLQNNNTDESWEIIENLALYDHEGWDETNEFVKPVKAIAIPHGIPKTPDRRLLKLEDQISFLLKGSRPTPTSSLAHAPQAFVKAAHPNSRPQNQNEPPTLNTFAFHKRASPSPQLQALETTFETRVRDYMEAHTERMERSENTIFKQREEINGRMTEMFGLLKELTTSRTPEKVIIREEAKFPVTKDVNSISLAKGGEERSNKRKVTPDNTEKPTETGMKIPVKEVETKDEAENRSGNESIKTPESEEVVEAPGSQPVVNPSWKEKKKAYNVLPGGPVYEAILKKKITKKEDIGGNFEIPCSIGGLKHVNALVDQGIPKPLFHVEKGIKNDIEPIAPTITVNRLVPEWEERIRLHQEKEMEFNQWRSKNFKDERPALTEEEEGVEDEGEVTLYLLRRSLEVLRKLH
ncbi:zinc finger, CCHC-type containing protein [Tanacetum coccineum]